MNEDDERRMAFFATEIAAKQGGVWTCLLCAAVFGAMSFFSVVGTGLRHRADWLTFLGGCFFTVLCVYSSVASWQEAERARGWLAQLQANNLKEAAAQPGVWPPAPNQ